MVENYFLKYFYVGTPETVQRNISLGVAYTSSLYYVTVLRTSTVPDAME